MLGVSYARLLVPPVLVSACHTSRVVPISPNDSGPLPAHSTVVLMGGERVPVEDGRTTRDSLVGSRAGGARYAVPRDSVAYVEERKVSVARSVGLGAAGLIVVLAVLAAAALAAAFGSFQ